MNHEDYTVSKIVLLQFPPTLMMGLFPSKTFCVYQQWPQSTRLLVQCDGLVNGTELGQHVCCGRGPHTKLAVGPKL